ncbi:bacteriophage CI repressor [Salmonella enterica]|uniref:hypothetical protein n=1 Tax=Salmonella bongori TaxID=54736 RepID=UPI000FA778D0|nr:hypothetical protein [Salmonella bongori]EAR7731059.1 hypothetical protein [Salmonella enterica]EBG5306222.1 bacteriophage CI repressor [Salmonella enterica subsp. enterica serovar Oranienburg]ECG0679615.1 hypothetical protein [Salmonella enterica subsp. salamae]EDU8320709.1 bacteriophage CI repressor [Salmonella enterica subsp. diarizonae]EEL9728533.1 bacteriophage CI repressor [Salmonella enterica subsp. enterica serovar Infantis]EHJ6432564.1 hypothetical protein [Salmonella enterica sub
MKKEPSGSFPGQEKEPIIERIFKLVERYPSRSEAARKWGINESTLKNYYKRRDIAPTPRINQLRKIAESEDVSLEWLQFGVGEEPKETFQKRQQSNPLSASDIDNKILTFLSFLDDSEKQRLIDVLGRKGAEHCLILLDGDITELHALEGVRRSLALSLKNIPDERVREIYEACETTDGHFTITDKQARA